MDASASDSDREGEEEDGGAGAGDNKAASFARAFAKIIAGGQTRHGILSVSGLCCLITGDLAGHGDLSGLMAGHWKG